MFDIKTKKNAAQFESAPNNSGASENAASQIKTLWASISDIRYLVSLMESPRVTDARAIFYMLKRRADYSL